MANDGKRFIKGSGIAKHREWRGLKDTFYDYTQWVVNLGLLVQFVAKSPVRIMRGMLEYRWLGSYLGSLNMGQLLEELMDLAKTNGISLPAGLSMLGRGVMTIEGVITACCPQVSVIQIIVNHLAGGIKDQFDVRPVESPAGLSKQGRHCAGSVFRRAADGR